METIKSFLKWVIFISFTLGCYVGGSVSNYINYSIHEKIINEDGVKYFETDFKEKALKYNLLHILLDK